MGVNVWRSLSRGILVFTNVLFLLLGIVLVTLGGYMMSLPDLNEFSDGGISGAIVTCGCLILLIAALGCCGAQWDSKVFLFPYATLVVVSVIAQFALGGFLFHIHSSLLHASKHNFDLGHLNSSDQSVLNWINHRFTDAYEQCGLSVDLNLSLQDHALVATCENPHFEWFGIFIEQNCRINSSDLVPTSDFMKCVGTTFTLSEPITRHAMLCACESRMMTWVNDQSFVISVFVFTIAAFEIVLVCLSCYVMCSRRSPRRYGYQEIRMPVKDLHPRGNAHPRNYYPPAATAVSTSSNQQLLNPYIGTHTSYHTTTNQPQNDRIYGPSI